MSWHDCYITNDNVPHIRSRKDTSIKLIRLTTMIAHGPGYGLWVQSWADKQFFCNHTQFQLINVRWVAWRTNQYYMTNLFTIPPMWERLHPLFNVTDMFTQLSHKVLLPRNDLWALILRHFLGYLSASNTRVGLQIRLHGRPNLAEYDQDVFDRILDCMQTHKVYLCINKAVL